MMNIYKITMVVLMLVIGLAISTNSYCQLASYSFSGNLNDNGTNSITAISNYGVPLYEQDRNGAAGYAWNGPQVNLSGLSIPSFKAIGGSGKRSVTAWFKLDAGATGRNTIVSWGKNTQGNMFNVMIDGGVPRIEGGSCSLKTSDTGLNDNNWHHIAVTYDPADGDKLQNVKVYINGSLSSNELDAGASYRSEVVAIATDNTTNDVQIGYAVYTSSGYFFKGNLDEVKIYDVALTAQEISDLNVPTALTDLNGSDKFSVSVVSNKTIEIKAEESALCKVYSISGQIILQNKLKIGANQINTNAISGVYLIKIEADNNRQFFKKVFLR